MYLPPLPLEEEEGRAALCAVSAMEQVMEGVETMAREMVERSASELGEEGGELVADWRYGRGSGVGNFHSACERSQFGFFRSRDSHIQILLIRVLTK